MTKVQAVEQEVRKLNRSKLAEFRQWFMKFDARLWDEQMERDIHKGKLSKLSQEALKAHASGKTRAL